MYKKAGISEKQERRKKVIKISVSLFFALIMVTSIAGVVLSFGGFSGSASGSIADGRYKYRQNTDTTKLGNYVSTIDGNSYYFFTLPSQAQQSYVIDPIAVNLVKSDGLQLTFVPAENATQVLDVVRLNLAADAYSRNIIMQSGVAQSSQQYSFLPVITCDQGTVEAPVLELSYGTQSQITTQGNCVKLSARSEADMLLMSDLIRFHRLGAYTE